MFDVVSSVSQSKLNVWCISSFWTHPNLYVYIYIYSVYIYIYHMISPLYPMIFPLMVGISLKAHSVSMAVRTSKDVAGGC